MTEDVMRWQLHTWPLCLWHCYNKSTRQHKHPPLTCQLHQDDGEGHAGRCLLVVGVALRRETGGEGWR